jgi:hypothetical protein
MMLRALAVLSVAAAGTCGPRPTVIPYEVQKEKWDGGVDCRACERWEIIEVMGPLPAPLDELSGLAASRAYPGVIYAHNDSGDTARFFAMDVYGHPLAEVRLQGAGAVDWEDMALGPCGKETCLFFGDIGDNMRKRSDYTVYRVREPTIPAAVLRDVVPEPLNLEAHWEPLPFGYPGGERFNAEALLVHPVTGDLYVVTKEQSAQRSRVFKFPQPLTPRQTVTLIDLGPAAFPTTQDTLATAADIHPCGNQLLVRMYNRIASQRLDSPDAGFDSIFTQPVYEMPTPIDEPQGEAIAWGPDGQSFFTASEHTGQQLHRVRCIRAP